MTVSRSAAVRSSLTSVGSASLVPRSQQWFFTIGREPRFDQLVSLMDPQLDADGRLIQAGDAVRFNAVQNPHVPDVLKPRLVSLLPHRRPIVGHGADRSSTQSLESRAPSRRANARGSKPRCACLGCLGSVGQMASGTTLPCPARTAAGTPTSCD